MISASLMGQEKDGRSSRRLRKPRGGKKEVEPRYLRQVAGEIVWPSFSKRKKGKAKDSNQSSDLANLREKKRSNIGPPPIGGEKGGRGAISVLEGVSATPGSPAKGKKGDFAEVRSVREKKNESPVSIICRGKKNGLSSRLRKRRKKKEEKLSQGVTGVAEKQCRRDSSISPRGKKEEKQTRGRPCLNRLGDEKKAYISPLGEKRGASSSSPSIGEKKKGARPDRAPYRRKGKVSLQAVRNWKGHGGRRGRRTRFVVFYGDKKKRDGGSLPERKRNPVAPL